MNHVSYENWLEYTQDLLDEQTRSEYENHLYSCDHCLTLYLQAVEATELQMPELQNPSGFADSIMKEISDQKQQAKVKPKKEHRKQTLIHYTVAAAMTLTFMSTGVFSQFMSAVSHFENTASGHEKSVVGNWLNKTESITKRMEMNMREGNPNE